MVIESYICSIFAGCLHIEAHKYIANNPNQFIKLVTSLFSITNENFSTEFTLFFVPSIKELMTAVITVLYQLSFFLLNKLNVSILALSFTGFFVGGSGLYVQILQQLQLYWYQATVETIQTSVNTLYVFSSVHQVINALYLLHTIFTMSLEVCQRCLQLFVPSFSFQHLWHKLYTCCFLYNVKQQTTDIQLFLKL